MSRKKSRKGASGPMFLVSPPLETLVEISTKANFPPINYTLTAKDDGDKSAFLQRFMSPPLPSDLSARTFGNAEDLFGVQENAAKATNIMHTMCSDLEQYLKRSGKGLPLRTETAANLVMLGAAMITSAYILHLRPVAWTQGPALVVLRSGIESIARGGWVALGRGDEPSRINGGERPSAQACLSVVDGHLQTHREPIKIYVWLCNFTHLDYRVAVKGPPATQEVYAAAAYVAWLGAKVTEIVIGQAEPIAIAPRLPSPAPWQ